MKCKFCGAEVKIRKWRRVCANCKEKQNQESEFDLFGASIEGLGADLERKEKRKDG